MKRIIIKIGNILFTPFYLIIIGYYIFRPYLVNLPFINVIRLLLLLLVIFVFILGMLNVLLQPQKNHFLDFSNIKNKSIIEVLLINSKLIINMLFYVYLFIYILFRLDTISVLFNYLLLLFLGMFLGGQILEKSYKQHR